MTTAKAYRHHVLVIAKHAPPIKCGAGVYSYTLSEELKKAGCRVHLFANRPRWGLKAFHQFRRLLKQPFDTVHVTHSSEFPTWSWVGIIPWLAKRRVKQVIVTYIDYEIGTQMREWLFYWMAKNADALIFIEERKYEHFIAKHPQFGSRARLIPASSLVAWDTELNNRFQFIRRPGEKIIATFGFAKPDKGIETILYALKRITAQDKNVRFLFISSLHDGHNDTYALKLDHIIEQEKLEPYIIKTGFCEGGMLLDFLKAADVFVCPFRDGFSSMHTTALTALSVGLPVVSTRNGASLPRGVENDKNIVLIDIDNPERLAEEVMKILQNNQLRNEMKVAAQRLFDSHFSWPVIVQSHLDVYARAHAN